MQQQLPLSHVQSSLDRGLIEAYEATDFHVDDSPSFVLKIGASSRPLAQLYLKHGCECAAYVTACNPLGENVGQERNAELQRQLTSKLARGDFAFLPGIGQDSKGKWPGEPSYLVLGIQLNSAMELGNTLRQNAIVWCDADTVPQLILLR